MHIKQISHLFTNVLTGSYINFAICEYYCDSIFTQFSQTFLSSVIYCDLNELRSYSKVDKRVHHAIMQFFNNHLVILFTKFEADLIEKLLQVLLFAMSDP